MKKLLILLFLIFVILVSGCVEQDGQITPTYYDEALKMETEVTGEVLPSQGINLKVRLINQVPDDVENVSFDITDLYALQVIRINCGTRSCGGGQDDTSDEEVKCYSSTSSGHLGCYFKSIQSLDDREINFVLKVPTQEELARIGRELKPELTLEYEFDGETTFLIPILGPNERSTDAKSQLIQTKGPIHVDIERGFTSSNYGWEWNGSGFSIVMRVKDVLTSESHVTIDKNEFTVTLTNLENKTEFGRCDFKNWEEISTDVFTANPEENITLPMQTPLVCALEGYSKGMPWIYGQVRVKYNDYRYKAVETKSIQVETVIV